MTSLGVLCQRPFSSSSSVCFVRKLVLYNETTLGEGHLRLIFSVLAPLTIARCRNMTTKYIRKYRAVFEYDAQDNSELSIREGDVITVHPNSSGAWPDAGKWMTGTNVRTSQSGEFPGNYTTFVCEEEIPPTPPPRRQRPKSTCDPDKITLDPSPLAVGSLPHSRSSSTIGQGTNHSSSNGGTLVETIPTKPHNWKEVQFKIPFKCYFCEFCFTCQCFIASYHTKRNNIVGPDCTYHIPIIGSQSTHPFGSAVIVTSTPQVQL